MKFSFKSNNRKSSKVNPDFIPPKPNVPNDNMPSFQTEYDIRKSFREAYEQGKFDGVMNATNGLAVVKGYDVRAVVLCGNCKYYSPDGVYHYGFCSFHKENKTKYDFCSEGKVRDNGTD